MLSKPVKFGLIAAVGAALLAALIWFASPARLLETLRGTRPGIVALFWSVSLLATVLRTWRFGLFVPLAGRRTIAYGVFCMTRLLNLALPFRTGEFASLALLKRTGLVPTIAEWLPVWAVLHVGDIAALSAWFSVIIGISALGSEYEFVGWAALAVSLGSLVLLYAAPRFLRFRSDPRGWVGGRIAAAVNGLKHVGVMRHQAGSLALSVLLWAALVLSMIAAQKALDSPLTALDCAVVAIIALSATVLPINAPLGIGTGDAVWAVAMTLFGIPPREAVAIALGMRVLILGGIALEALVGFALVRRAGYSLAGLIAFDSAGQVAPRK